MNSSSDMESNLPPPATAMAEIHSRGGGEGNAGFLAGSIGCGKVGGSSSSGRAGVGGEGRSGGSIGAHGNGESFIG